MLPFAVKMLLVSFVVYVLGLFFHIVSWNTRRRKMYLESLDIKINNYCNKNKWPFIVNLIIIVYKVSKNIITQENLNLKTM